MGASGHVIRRVLLVIPLLLGITVLIFIVTHLVPHNPLVLVIGDKAASDPVLVKAATEKWGLDRSLPEQYFVYMWNLVHGDLGISLFTRRPVIDDLTLYLPATIELAIAAMIFAVAVGLPLGILAAIRPRTWIDHVARIISVLGASVPPFWSGLIALFVFYNQLGILPGPGRIDARFTAPPTITGLYVIDSAVAGQWDVCANALQHLILPAIILGWFTLALICRVTRSSLLEVLGSDYIRTARAKGLGERVVVLLHALRNALIPTVTVFGLAMAGLMAGAIMTEAIFSWPGIGSYAVAAASHLDYPSVMGVTMLIATIYILANLAVDIVYGIIDPRIREV